MKCDAVSSRIGRSVLSVSNPVPNTARHTMPAGRLQRAESVALLPVGRAASYAAPSTTFQ